MSHRGAATDEKGNGQGKLAVRVGLICPESLSRGYRTKKIGFVLWCLCGEQMICPVTPEEMEHTGPASFNRMTQS